MYAMYWQNSALTQNSAHNEFHNLHKPSHPLPQLLLCWLMTRWRSQSPAGATVKQRTTWHVSKSREKSYGTNTQTAPKQQKQQYFFLLCLGASLCNSGLLAGVKWDQKCSGSIQNDPYQIKTKYPAVPTGLAVGTNPPGLPSGDHRWEVWKWVQGSVPRIRSVGYSSNQIRY